MYHNMTEEQFEGFKKSAMDYYEQKQEEEDLKHIADSLARDVKKPSKGLESYYEAAMKNLSESLARDLYKNITETFDGGNRILSPIRYDNNVKVNPISDHFKKKVI
jgi:hypothetical protein